MQDLDFEGLNDMPGDKAAVEEVLNRIDLGERPTSADMLLLRWYCGIPIKEPKNLRQIEMAVTGE